MERMPDAICESATLNRDGVRMAISCLFGKTKECLHPGFNDFAGDMYCGDFAIHIATMQRCVSFRTDAAYRRAGIHPQPFYQSVTL
ncbi:MAG: hypothetical protein LBS42_11505 [Tannerella sp.]|nr:hypothetical protein [Tannerella sp.]